MGLPFAFGRYAPVALGRPVRSSPGIRLTSMAGRAAPAGTAGATAPTPLPAAAGGRGKGGQHADQPGSTAIWTGQAVALLAHGAEQLDAIATAGAFEFIDRQAQTSPS